MILGILALLGGIAVIGIVAGGNSGKTSEVLLADAKQCGMEAEKKWKQTGNPEDKAEIDKWQKLEKEIEQTLDKKKSEQQTGFIFGGVLAVVGIGRIEFCYR